MQKVTVIRVELTHATAAHTSIFRVNTVSSVSVMSAVGEHWLSANTGKIVQIDGASARSKKPSSENGSAVCWIEPLQFNSTKMQYCVRSTEVLPTL